jgi:hypothetical protein
MARDELVRQLKLTLVRYGVILPIQSVLPISLFVLLRRLVWPRDSASPRDTKNATWLWWLLTRAIRQLLRAWTTSELWFAAFYFLRQRALTNRRPAPKPPQTTGERLALLERCLDVYIDREVGSPAMLMGREPSSAELHRAASLQAVPALAAAKAKLGSKSMSFEHMLRLWDVQGTDPSEVLQDSLEVRTLVLKRASLSGWFHGADCANIRRGNAEQWVAWSFLMKRPEELSEEVSMHHHHAMPRRSSDATSHAAPSSATGSHRCLLRAHCRGLDVPWMGNVPWQEMTEVGILVDRIASWADLKLEPGFNAAVRCMRIDFDPIPSSYRPLCYYGVTAGLLPLANDFLMRRYGFEKFWSGCLEYWHKPPAGEADGPPVVFCHGLGIGVANYAVMLHELCERGKHRMLFFVSLPHIAQRPIETQASPREFVMSVSELLTAHRCPPEGVHFVGHSFGTFVCGWVMRFQPSLACRLTLLDPVCLLLCKHDVAHAILYKQPDNYGELLLQWFVGKELYTAHTLSRRSTPLTRPHHGPYGRCALTSEMVRGLPVPLDQSTGRTILCGRSRSRAP